MLAINAWSTELREYARKIITIGSEMGATAPCPEELDRIGWDHGVGITDAKMLLNWQTATVGRRVAFGKAMGKLVWGGRPGTKYDGAPPKPAELIASFRTLSPALAFVPISHTCHGPIDRSPDGLPFYEPVGGRKDIVAGLGFSGNGVVPWFVGGQILASMVLESDDGWSRSPLVRSAPATYPPEPVRT